MGLCWDIVEWYADVVGYIRNSLRFQLWEIIFEIYWGWKNGYSPTIMAVGCSGMHWDNMGGLKYEEWTRKIRHRCPKRMMILEGNFEISRGNWSGKLTIWGRVFPTIPGRSTGASAGSPAGVDSLWFRDRSARGRRSNHSPERRSGSCGALGGGEPIGI